MFDEPPITNQKDMPECNTFLDKCENIALRQISKKIFALYLFVTKSIVIMILLKCSVFTVSLTHRCFV